MIPVMAFTPEPPVSMAGLDYVKANNIEQILLDLDALIDNITKSWKLLRRAVRREV